MLYSLYENILTILKEEFKDFGLSEADFSLDPFDNKYPFFTIKGQLFNLKIPLLKKPEGVNLLPLSEKMTVPSTQSGKKGPYALQAPVAELDSILIVTKPGTAEESVQSLHVDKYTINEKELTLTDEYVGGTHILVSYKALGEKFSERFELKFTLKIYEQDPLKQEQYALLTIPAIWANMPDIMDHAYQYTSGSIHAVIHLSELAFNGQTTDPDKQAISNLDFSMSGIADYVKYKSDGFHIIEEVVLGNTETISQTRDGLSIGIVDD